MIEINFEIGFTFLKKFIKELSFLPTHHLPSLTKIWTDKILPLSILSAFFHLNLYFLACNLQMNLQKKI